MGFYGRIVADVKIEGLKKERLEKLKRELKKKFGSIDYEGKYTLSIIWEDDLPFNILDDWREFFEAFHRKHGVKVFLYLYDMEEPTEEEIIGGSEDDEDEE